MDWSRIIIGSFHRAQVLIYRAPPVAAIIIAAAVTPASPSSASSSLPQLSRVELLIGRILDGGAIWYQKLPNFPRASLRIRHILFYSFIFFLHIRFVHALLASTLRSFLGGLDLGPFRDRSLARRLRILRSSLRSDQHCLAYLWACTIRWPLDPIPDPTKAHVSTWTVLVTGCLRNGTPIDLVMIPYQHQRVDRGFFVKAKFQDTLRLYRNMVAKKIAGPSYGSEIAVVQNYTSVRLASQQIAVRQPLACARSSRILGIKKSFGFPPPT
jgi:hypothetical protein